ncbi:hypothetical protein D3C75_777590 [compost metagenome]
MGYGDNFVDALCFQHGYCIFGTFYMILEADFIPWRGQPNSILSGQAENTDLFTINILDDRRIDIAVFCGALGLIGLKCADSVMIQLCQFTSFCRKINIRAGERELCSGDEIFQHLRLLLVQIELVVAERHGVITDVVHELNVGLPFKLCKIQGAGENVACIQQHGIACPFTADGRGPLGDVFQMAMRIIGVQDTQIELVGAEINLRQQRIVVAHASIFLLEVGINVHNVQG